MQRMLGKQTTILCYFMRCMAKLPDYFGKDISLLLLSNISDLIIQRESNHDIIGRTFDICMTSLHN